MRRPAWPSLALLMLLALPAGPAPAADHQDAPILVGPDVLVFPDVRGVRVVQTLGEPGEAEITVSADAPPIRPGEKLEIRANGDPASEAIFVGEVVGLEPVFRSGVESAVVRGFDRLHRLSRGRKTRSFDGIEEAELVARIAAAHGLALEGADPGFASGYVLQRNESDLEFLRERARRIGYQIHVDGDTLHFAPPAPDPAARLVFGAGLRSFVAEPTTEAQVAKVVVRGWNPVDKAAVSGEAGDASAPPEAAVLFDRAEALSEDPSLSEGLLFSPEEAALVAQGALAAAAGAARAGTGVADGDPRIRAGAVVELGGLGDRFNGRYLVTGATHSIEPTGYRTEFRVRALPAPRR